MDTLVITMTGGVFGIIFLLFFNQGHAQFLPVNESGKCELSEVVLAEGLPKTILNGNTLQWFMALDDSDGKLSPIQQDSLEGRTAGDYEFLVYSQSGILRKIAGAIRYHLSVEIKDGKYRYTFTDFIFYYYKQDRNYQMVKTGKTKPLEETEAAGWQKIWTQHRRTVYSLVNNQIAELKTKMIEIPNTSKNKPAEKKVDW
jgi:hypothetical protein